MRRPYMGFPIDLLQTALDVHSKILRLDNPNDDDALLAVEAAVKELQASVRVFARQKRKADAQWENQA